jgi:hypothetical protein
VHRAQVDTISLPDRFVQAVMSQGKVEGSPHNLYKYPARFAPEFAREAILAFSKPTEVVLDPFSGSGTSLIEAVASGRRAIGYDISSLACFIARAKSVPLSVHNARRLTRWVNNLALSANTNSADVWRKLDSTGDYYRRNLSDEIASVLGALVVAIGKLPDERERRFARLVLLAVSQSALDCKKALPTAAAILSAYQEALPVHLDSFRAYTRETARHLQVTHSDLALRRRIINASSETAATDSRYPAEWGKAKLVVTSPPYPGVHMLYHRWQLLGRKETPAPFLLANCRDGDGIGYYCLGGRHPRGVAKYFDRIEKIRTSG